MVDDFLTAPENVSGSLLSDRTTFKREQTPERLTASAGRLSLGAGHRMAATAATCPKHPRWQGRDPVEQVLPVSDIGTAAGTGKRNQGNHFIPHERPGR